MGKKGIRGGILLLTAVLLFAACEQATETITVPEAAAAAVSGDTITGWTSAAIDPVDLTITISGEKITTPIGIEDNLSSWFANLPAGLTAAAKYPSPEGAKMVTVTSGNAYTLYRVTGDHHSGSLPKCRYSFGGYS